MFMRVNAKCAHHVRPTLEGRIEEQAEAISAAALTPLPALGDRVDGSCSLVAPTVVTVNPPTVDSI